MGLQTVNGKLIHIALIQGKGRGSILLFLRENSLKHYEWFKVNSFEEELKTSVFANTIEEALRLGAQHWKKESFRTLICGFRYTLPERDEHGINALFCQMAASYTSMNGIYFDEDLSSNCIVHNASIEARELLKKLK